MIAFLVLAVIIGASLILIEEGLRRAPEGVEDEHGFHLIGESAKKDEDALEHAGEGAHAAIHPSFS